MADSLIGCWTGRNSNEKFLKQLAAVRGSHSTDQIAASLFSEVVPTAALYSKAIAHIVNFYLSDNRKDAREEVARLAKLDTPEVLK